MWRWHRWSKWWTNNAWPIRRTDMADFGMGEQWVFVASQQRKCSKCGKVEQRTFETP